MSRSSEWVPGLWQDVFNELLFEDSELDYGDEWSLQFNYSLTNDLTDGQRGQGWKVTCPQTMGRFQCSACARTWTSAKVRLVFHYRLQRNRGRGTVIMRPFGQRCLACQSNTFNLPGFSEEKAEEVLLRLFYRIRKNCYRVEVDEDVSPAGPSPRFRGRPHEASLCEACAEGVCTQAEDVCAQAEDVCAQAEDVCAQAEDVCAQAEECS